MKIEQNNRIILHIDMDYFFAQIEEVLNPDLKGKPVVVGADPKGGKGRGVVSTANYVARKYGIRSGMPISKAYRLCNWATFLPVRYELYEKISSEIMEILRSYGDKFEQVSIDEAYLDLSSVKSYAKALNLAVKIKKEILKKHNLTCSIGLGPNKLIAKIASDFRKPNGLTIVRPNEVLNFLATLSARQLPGIGPKSEAILNKIGIKTIAQLRTLEKEQLKDLFGKFGERVYEMSRGIDYSPVQEVSEIKSIGKQITFERDTLDKNLIFENLNHLISELCANLRSLGGIFGTITIKVRYSDFDTHTSSRTLPYTSSEAIAKNIAKELMLPWLRSEKRIRLIGVSFSKLKFKK